jgi:malonate-semialdehyde dehydrogenase (acetylating) / methylmalonate-semialdehyde dehydrogenase
VEVITHWIDGRAIAPRGERQSTVWNPASGVQRAWVELGGAAEVDQAVRAASRAFESWSQASLARRTQILFAFREGVRAQAQRIAEAIADEHGKTVGDALGEVQRGLEVIDFACGIASLLKGDYSDQVSQGVDLFSFREPLGVVAGITPFNFPAMVPMWMFPLAIACGNSFVLKPSERDPSASMLLAQLWAEAGLPAGVFNVVHGDKAAVDALLAHPQIAAISFVGSTPTARYVHQRGTATGKRVQALGGAKNHAVILADADEAFAAEQLASAAFGSAGQRCMAISAAVVVGVDGDGFAENVSGRAASIRVGPGRDPHTQMGPVVTREARERIVRMIGSAERQGAAITLDGRGIVVPGHEAGFFVGPTVLDRVEPRMDVYRDEVFGPVLCLLRARSLEEAIELVNANPYGNGAAIFTRSGSSAREFQRRVRAGMIGINVPLPVPMAYYSFGGWKDSLFGDSRIYGPEGVAFYTRAKVVTSRWPQREVEGSASYHFPTAR